MHIVRRQFNEEELLDILSNILQIVIAAFDSPLRKDFEKQSRATQIGYDITKLLVEKGFLAVGQREEQMRIETEKKEREN